MNASSRFLKRNSESNLPQSAARARISWPHLVLSVIGIGISGYAWRLHGIVKAGGDSGCGISETISCDKVIASPYAAVFGIPLGVFGALFFVVVLMSAIDTRPIGASVRALATQRLALTTVGLLSSVALTYISIRLIGAACPVCLATHATTLSLFLVSFFGWLKSRRSNLA